MNQLPEKTEENEREPKGEPEENAELPQAPRWPASRYFSVDWPSWVLEEIADELV